MSLAVLSVCACGATSDPNWDSTQLIVGSVKTDTGNTLVSFCAPLSTLPGDVVQFRAAPGTHVIDDVMREGRSYSWYGGDTGDQPLSFWCAGGGQLQSSVPGTFPKCFRVADADPPASLDNVEQKGAPLGTEFPGYTLSLTVLHPGVLNLRLDVQCMHDVYGVTRVEHPPERELTILGN